MNTLCNKQQAIALQRPTKKPATRRLFYARLAAYAAALAAALVLTGCDDLQAAHAKAVERVADRQDRDALSSREWAGQQVCGPHATAVWTGNKEMQCFKHARLAHGEGK